MPATPLHAVDTDAPDLDSPAERIPPKGRAAEELLTHMRALRGDDADWKNARTWSLVYFADDDYYSFLKEAHGTFFSENALNPMAFKSLKKMESEVVRMTADMLNGDADAVGTMTSGGTESLLLAVKTYRDLAKKRKPWILRPNVVMPRTAHPAFEKACHYFGVKPRFARVGKDYRVDMAHVKKLTDKSTIMLVGSAPQYPHGVIDPIEELGAFAEKKKIPLHVDACIGGFVLPWIEKLGHAVPRWDFRVPGVTSISADLHKYGYAAKGASTIVYRSMKYLKHQFFIATDFPGGVYISPSMPGTRPGGAIAAAWAALMKMGEDGYLQHTERALDAMKRLQAGIANIDGVRVLSRPDSTLLPWAGDDGVDTFVIADRMQERGWLIDRQHRPACVHLTVTSNHLDVVDDYLRDLEAAVRWARANPDAKASGEAAMYGMMGKLPLRGLVRYSVQKVMEGMYSPSGEMPDLGDLGSDDDSLFFKLLGKHQGTALRVLDKASLLRQRVLGGES